ncbi:unnamed protein product [Kluyveromyces dobzhanskii CBS 2104]|uniref:WGS project CCBQ000000000 data, contig 00098 n=1 Tax=Kluyveromyces dobzhanskii CBS 2104 TaxID=1427455 RepID=A0A0A8L391_9SACH|nr:unnamed protein product [Kluyveromyces dobzhanskii CBS 2104]
MGIPINLESLEVIQTDQTYGVSGRAPPMRRGSSYTAGNSLVSSRGTMNGVLTVRKTETHELRTGVEMNSATVEGFLVLWDKQGSQIVVVSPVGDVAVYHVEGGISGRDELVRVARISWNEFLFMGHWDAVYFGAGESVGIRHECWDVGPVVTMWHMQRDGTFCCVMPDGTAHISEDPRTTLRRRTSLDDETLQSRQMTHYIRDYAMLEACPTKNSLAIAKKSGDVAVLVDGTLRFITGLGLTEEERFASNGYHSDSDDRVMQMSWSSDGRFLCIVTKQRIYVYDEEQDAVTVVAGEAPGQLISWGSSCTTLFLLSTHLYGTMLKAFEHNQEEQQWICCGFEDIRSQFEINRVHAFKVSSTRDSLTIYHDENTIDTFEYKIT